MTSAATATFMFVKTFKNYRRSKTEFWILFLYNYFQSYTQTYEVTILNAKTDDFHKLTTKRRGLHIKYDIFELGYSKKF